MRRSIKSIVLTELHPPRKDSRIQIPRESIEELAESMRKLGLLQPVLVREEVSGYQIEAGHRRFLAAQLLRWKEIDCIILDATDEDGLHLERAHENLIRQDLNPVEEAKIVWDLVYEDGRGVDKTAALLCKRASWISSRLDIWKMPDDLKAAIADGRIKVAVAKELDRIGDAEARARMLKSVVEYGASSETVRAWISDYRTGDYLKEHELLETQSDSMPLDRTQITMPCRICNLSHGIDILRHIWCCPDCLSVVRALARETQAQLETG